MNPKPLRQVELYTDAGKLEALYRDIERPSGVAIICHPHPLHGGTLHNKVVFRTARGLEAANIATLRFNFRGVGASEGKHDDGRGEVRDVEAAIAWVKQRHADRPVLLGGFSFGSWVASRVGCDAEAVKALFLIGVPVNKYDLSHLENCEKPKLIVQGSRDEHGAIERLEKLVEHVPNCETVVVAEADHFFSKQLEVLEETVRDWAVRILEEVAS